MRILGIDPGSHLIGYGLLVCEPGHYHSEGYGTVQVPPGTPIPEALLAIYHDMQELLSTYQPDILVVERLFFFRNVTTAMSVAQARGVIILSGQQHQVELAEYTPMQVKMSLTGYGKASKREVQEMVKECLKLTQIPRPDDAADALALAITHAHFSGF
ncbi:MAG: crossover junction endodeoxyribonuclease RuvC [Candidatus Sericytochromatia bacterium]